MASLWKVSRSDSYLGPFAELADDVTGEYSLTVADGAEGAHITVSREELLDLAYKIYEELR